MATTFKAPTENISHLGAFWANYFRETPVCSDKGCGDVAVEVDPFFPYLDDYNRCKHHRSGWEKVDFQGVIS